MSSTTRAVELAGMAALATAVFLSGWADGLRILPGFTWLFLLVVMAAGLGVFAAIARRNFDLTPVDVWLSAYLVMMAYVAAAFGQIASFKEVFFWSVFLSAFFAARLLVRSEQSLRLLVWCGLVATVVIVSGMSRSVFESGALTRFSVNGLNTNFTSFVVAGVLLLQSVYVSMGKRTRLQEVADLVVSLALLGVLVAFDTRAALLAGIAIVTLRYWGHFVRHSAMVSLVAALALAALLGAFGFLDWVLYALDSILQRSTGDLAGRLTIWPEARAVFFQNWLLGVGPGNYIALSESGVMPHNFFLTVALDTGIVGLGVMCVAIVAFGRHIAPVQLGPRKASLLALYAAYWLPIASSGHWEVAVFSWIVIGVGHQVAGFSAARQKAEPAEALQPVPIQ